MGKKRKHEAVAGLGQPMTDLVGAVEQIPSVERPAAAVVLLVDRLDAHRRWCAAGTVIAPNVDGWPPHRVQLHLQHGYARYLEAH